MSSPATPWPHAPAHQLGVGGTFFVTASTYRKEHHFRSARRLAVLHRGLLTVARDFGWRLEAWSVFSNHYHFLGCPASDSPTGHSLSAMLGALHSKTAIWINRLDGTPGRKVWFNYRETRITFPRSHLARLSYTHQNPVKHGLVARASLYPWCSASWFERTASPAQVRTVYRFRTDRLEVPDSFEVSEDW
ncbi:MAG: transposase [Verrucomicrobia bacterium]|nr:transposase [Verrucomicrobiota bacterium]